MSLRSHTLKEGDQASDLTHARVRLGHNRDDEVEEDDLDKEHEDHA